MKICPHFIEVEDALNKYNSEIQSTEVLFVVGVKERFGLSNFTNFMRIRKGSHIEFIAEFDDFFGFGNPVGSFIKFL